MVIDDESRGWTPVSGEFTTFRCGYEWRSSNTRQTMAMLMETLSLLGQVGSWYVALAGM